MLSSPMIVFAICGLMLRFASAGSSPQCKSDKDCEHGYCIGWFNYGQFLGKCGAKGSEADGGRCSRDLECSSGHCLAGHCLDKGKKCSGSSLKAGCDFEIVLDKSGGEELGLDLNVPTLKIVYIGPGLVQKWNKKHPERQVHVSDRIVSINGSPFWAEDVLDQMKKKQLLKITLMVGSRVQREDEYEQGSWEEAITAEKNGERKWEVFNFVHAKGVAPSVVAFSFLGFSGVAFGLVVARRHGRDQRSFSAVETRDQEVPIE